MTIRLLHIVPSLDYSGPLKQMVLLSSRLPREHFDVRVFSLAGDGPLSANLRNEHVAVMEPAPRLHRMTRSFFGSLQSAIRKFEPHIAHTWTTSANFSGRAEAIRARVPHLVASRRTVPNRCSFAEMTADRFLTRWTQKYVVNTRRVRNACVEHGLPSSKITVIPNGVEARKGKPELSRQELLQRHGLPADARMIGAIGPLRAEKGIKDLIWAADLLKVIRHDVYLLIVGAGPHAWRLKRFRDLVRIQDRVLFLGTCHDLPLWLRHLDCVWLANQRDALCNSLLEAMSAGVPVIATDTPGNREAVADNETGFLVPIGDRAAIARRTQRLLNDAQLAAACGRAARQLVQDRFGVQPIVDQYARMYQQLVERG